MIIELFLFSQLVHSQDLSGEELYVAKTKETSSLITQSTQMEKSESLKKENNPKVSPKIIFTSNISSNLPTQYLAKSHRQSTQSELLLPPKGSSELFIGLNVGEKIELTVNHSVIAFSDEKSPVIAEAHIGRYRGLKFIGESYLEPNTKRIFIDFNKIIQGHTIYHFKGVGVSDKGQPGLLGKYHSQEAYYFAGDFIASFTAGYFDGLVPRRTNVFGQIEQDTSVDSAVKKGLSSGALSTAERFREKLKKVPEFSEIEGSFDIQMLTLEPAINN